MIPFQHRTKLITDWYLDLNREPNAPEVDHMDLLVVLSTYVTSEASHSRQMTLNNAWLSQKRYKQGHEKSRFEQTLCQASLSLLNILYESYLPPNA